MVEAAMIIPLVIAGVMAVIYIVIGLYSSLSLQAALHMDMRKECGEYTKTVSRIETIKNYNSKMDFVGLRPVIRMEEEREHKIRSVFKQSLIRKEAGRAYIIDEAELIRILSFEGGDGT